MSVGVVPDPALTWPGFCTPLLSYGCRHVGVGRAVDDGDAEDAQPDVAADGGGAEQGVHGRQIGDGELADGLDGDPDDDPLLLVMGLGGPMTWWDPQMCRIMADQGFYVVRFDNRDVGQSSITAIS